MNWSNCCEPPTPPQKKLNWSNCCATSRPGPLGKFLAASLTMLKNNQYYLAESGNFKQLWFFPFVDQFFCLDPHKSLFLTFGNDHTVVVQY